MSSQQERTTIERNPVEKYSLDIVDISELHTKPKEKELVRFFWYRCPKLIDALCFWLARHSIIDNILEVGCGVSPFPPATHLMDYNNERMPDRIVFKIDLDYDSFPYDTKFFNFTYCRHTLEDIQNPLQAFNEIVRVSNAGFIETPSPLIEIMKDVDGPGLSHLYRGYIHHRYLVWSDVTTNTLYFLPKYPIIEYLVADDNLREKYMWLINNHSLYWNNYYVWDSGHKPNIVIYRNGVNMNIVEDYGRLLNDSLTASIQYTNWFVSSWLKN